MISWQDDAIILESRVYGENSLIVTVLTQEKGRCAGLVRSRKQAQGVAEPGNHIRAFWQGRLPEHLGTFKFELQRAIAAHLMDDGLRLAALQSAAALCAATLPEQQPMPHIFESFAALTEMLQGDFWAPSYIQWEIGLLAALGFALDFSRCAATGKTREDCGNDLLAYVSPRTGRAVSLSAAEPYRDRLLPLPGFLIRQGEAEPQSLQQGMELTGYFLERNVLGSLNRPMPPARQRFFEQFRKKNALFDACGHLSGSKTMGNL